MGREREGGGGIEKGGGERGGGREGGGEREREREGGGEKKVTIDFRLSLKSNQNSYFILPSSETALILTGRWPKL